MMTRIRSELCSYCKLVSPSLVPLVRPETATRKAGELDLERSGDGGLLEGMAVA